LLGFEASVTIVAALKHLLRSFVLGPLKYFASDWIMHNYRSKTHVVGRDGQRVTASHTIDLYLLTFTHEPFTPIPKIGVDGDLSQQGVLLAWRVPSVTVDDTLSGGRKELGFKTRELSAEGIF
jgi:hypothetical protein